MVSNTTETYAYNSRYNWGMFPSILYTLTCDSRPRTRAVNTYPFKRRVDVSRARDATTRGPVVNVAVIVISFDSLRARARALEPTRPRARIDHVDGDRFVNVPRAIVGPRSPRVPVRKRARPFGSKCRASLVGQPFVDARGRESPPRIARVRSRPALTSARART